MTLFIFLKNIPKTKILQSAAHFICSIMKQNRICTDCVTVFACPLNCVRYVADAKNKNNKPQNSCKNIIYYIQYILFLVVIFIQAINKNYSKPNLTKEEVVIGKH